MIKLTNRMLNKYIIDGNDKVTKWAEDNLPLNYGHLEGGESVTYRAILGYEYQDNGTSLPTIEPIASAIKLYRRPRGDKLLSIKNLSKHAHEGDKLDFHVCNGEETLVSSTRPLRMVQLSLIKGYISICISGGPKFEKITQNSQTDAEFAGWGT
tara:strand:- start:14 stop:475 length:462 start_codon:yes stop_codon:yes gene_type:complete